MNFIFSKDGRNRFDSSLDVGGDFPYCISHCFAKMWCGVSKLKLLIIFWGILVHMIAIHYCAKEHLAWLNSMIIRAP